jgi:copper transport protein
MELMPAKIKQFLLLTAALLLAGALVPAGASGHAELLYSKPKAGQVLDRSPNRFLLVFEEEIDLGLVQLEVRDSSGRSVARGDPFNPGGNGARVAVRLEPGLEGTIVASYRAISEDGHPVAKRTVFRVRAPKEEKERAAPPPKAEPPGPSMGEKAGEHVDLGTGGATDAGFAVARGLGYLAMALAIGGVVFLLAAWLPGLAHVAGAGADWREVSDTFVRLVKRIVVAAAVVGVAATAGAIVFEAATATGTSFWSALDSDAIDAVADTRVVEAWIARLLVWLLLTAVLLAILRSRRAPILRRAALGATGTAPAPALTRTQLLLLGGAMLALAFTAPMAGHIEEHSPSGLLVCGDTLHVLCMCTWLGGLAMLLFTLPVAARPLSPPDRTRLWAAVGSRFSRYALIAVAVLLLTGIVQSVALVGSVDALFETAYGRLVLAKIALLLVLISFGAYNQRRLLPRLRALADQGDEPGRAAALLRRSVAFEVGLILVVLGVTSVLVATEPAVGA